LITPTLQLGNCGLTPLNGPRSNAKTRGPKNERERDLSRGVEQLSATPKARCPMSHHGGVGPKYALNPLKKRHMLRVVGLPHVRPPLVGQAESSRGLPFRYTAKFLFGLVRAQVSRFAFQQSKAGLPRPRASLQPAYRRSRLESKLSLCLRPSGRFAHWS